MVKTEWIEIGFIEGEGVLAGVGIDVERMINPCIRTCIHTGGISLVWTEGFRPLRQFFMEDNSVGRQEFFIKIL
jgi:hypothetical protein